MKQEVRVLVGTALGALMLLTAPPALAQSFPAPVGYVNDFAHVLTAEEAKGLESKLVAYKDATGIELSVATVPSLGDMSVEEYAVKLFAQWGIGQKGKDNGVLFLLAPKERKVRIEVGYGLESYLTDGTTGLILDQNAVPQFKKDKWSAGTIQSVDGIIAHLGATPYKTRLEEQEKAKEEKARADKAADEAAILFLKWLFVIALIVVPPVAILLNRRHRQNLREEIEQMTKECNKQLDRISNEGVSAGERLPRFEGKIPKKNFAEVKSELVGVPEKVSGFEKQLAALISKDHADKAGALSTRRDKLEELKYTLEEFSPIALITGLDSDIAEWKAAQGASKELFDSIPKKVVKAKKDEDVDAEDITKAEKIFQEAQAHPHPQTSIWEWAAIYALLQTADELLDPPAPVRSYSSSNYSTSGIGGGFGGSSGGGFSGFGGGSSGGGGASRGF